MENNPILSQLGDEEFQRELISTFISEAEEHLDTFESSLLSIENNENIDNSVYQAMRSAHSLKGSASMLGFNRISSFAHKVEDLLSFITKSKTAINQDIMNILYTSKDLLSSMIKSLLDENVDYENDIEMLERKISNIIENDSKSTAKIDTAKRTIKPLINMAVKPANHFKRPSESIRTPIRKINRIINLSMEMHLKYLNILNTIKGDLSIDKQYMLDEFQKMIELIQGESIKIRMQELNTVLSKFQRIVRDIAKSKNKEVAFEIEGGEIEIDRAILEKIEDPLKHMIRNSIDHGIEDPETRIELGKSREGKVSVKSYYANGLVRIEISDDGRGLDKEKILQKAVSNGLINEDDVLSDEEIYELIFSPGLSTAEEISEISGRGVGMDVVKRNISSIYGSIKIKTQKNKGTTFIIDIPLTLSIINGTYVKIKGELFVVPNRETVEFIEIKNINIYSSNSRKSALYNGELIPAIDVAKYLGVQNNKKTYRFVAIVLIENKNYALYIDMPLESDQMVIKSIEKNYKIINGILGTSIYKDGTLAPILDVRSIIKSIKNE